MKISNLDDIKKLSNSLQEKNKNLKARVLVCATGCRALGALEIAQDFRNEITRKSMEKEVRVIECGCIGMCSEAPVVAIEPAGFLYGKVKPKDIEEIIETSIKANKPVERLAVKENKKPLPQTSEVTFYKKQQKLVLGNCGQIDPKKIDDAIEKGAYLSTVQTLTEKKPQQLIDEITESGLRGRGGAGFPTGIKWNLARKTPGDEKFLICNADEGDPGAFMDRALLEGDPHKVIEGMIIAAYAIGANKGFIYVRAEYPIAVEHINIAIKQAHAYGLLGDNIAGTGFTFDIEVRMGAGAFVCGEETALIASLEGKRGQPKPRPPYPAQRGYKGKPTNINNVETFANLPIILKDGVEAYKSIGTEKSKGTKIFALAGKVNNTGLVEVPMGTTLREIVFDIGGGVPKKKAFKAAQLGGPSGGCIPEEYLDYQIDYDTLQEIGAIMGSGGLIVMDENTCMVDVAKYFLEFCQAESCGKCTPCREGTKRMLDTLKKICDGEGEEKDLETLEFMAPYIQKTSLCGLGQTAPNPVLSTLKHFRVEYEEHIKEGKCRSGVCKPLLTYEITQECTGCGVCKRVCPTEAIDGEKRSLHKINLEKCIKCGQCYDVCNFNAITR